MIKELIAPEIELQPRDADYEYLLAVSTDSIAVIDENYKLTEWIICQDDVISMTVFSAKDLDTFLDAINKICKLINAGINPLPIIYKTCC